MEEFHLINPVYPRWRGEHCCRGRVSFDKSGLSPLARGTRVQVFGVYLLARFIPAGAGNTNLIQLRG
ncbi:hypothetical protein FORC20_0915 [Salmonella enterica subsp. enterica serovar Typhimurium]|nr:hypothetical protein FORC20_0915 [Salmonella enterica subsp. enterica serovar Typhimurium]